MPVRQTNLVLIWLHSHIFLEGSRSQPASGCTPGLYERFASNKAEDLKYEVHN